MLFDPRPQLDRLHPGNTAAISELAAGMDRAETALSALKAKQHDTTLMLARQASLQLHFHCNCVFHKSDL